MSCSTSTIDLQFTQGDTYTHKFVYSNPDGTRIDLTDYTAIWTARFRFDDAAAIKTLTTPTGITVDALTGSLTINLESADTALFDWRGACYDLQLTDPAGDITTIARGQIWVGSQVT